MCGPELFDVVVCFFVNNVFLVIALLGSDLDGYMGLLSVSTVLHADPCFHGDALGLTVDSDLEVLLSERAAREIYQKWVDTLEVSRQFFCESVCCSWPESHQITPTLSLCCCSMV